MNDSKRTISHEDIQAALKKFQGAGGGITRLPDQEQPLRNIVGAEWAMYEPLLDAVPFFGTGSAAESASGASDSATEYPGSTGLYGMGRAVS